MMEIIRGLLNHFRFCSIPSSSYKVVVMHLKADCHLPLNRKDMKTVNEQARLLILVHGWLIVWKSDVWWVLQ